MEDLGAWRGASITEARCGEHLVRGIISRTSDERSGSQTNGARIIVVSREFGTMFLRQRSGLGEPYAYASRRGPTPAKAAARTSSPS